MLSLFCSLFSMLFVAVIGLRVLPLSIKNDDDDTSAGSVCYLIYQWRSVIVLAFTHRPSWLVLSLFHTDAQFARIIRANYSCECLFTLTRLNSGSSCTTHVEFSVFLIKKSDFLVGAWPLCAPPHWLHY